MGNDASRFVGDIPKHYDSGLGPNIFEYFAAQVAKRSAAFSPQMVLEIAAGTGFVSRFLRDALPDDVPLLVTDLNAPMLEIAAKKFHADEKVMFKPVDAMSLPFEDDQINQIVCQFGVMFFPDIVASYREVARVLRPGGQYIFSAWCKNADNPFSEVAHEAIAEFSPENPPGFYKIPFFYNDPDVVLSDLAEAGLTNASHEEMNHEREVTDLEAFARGLVLGNPVFDEIKDRGGVDPIDVVQRVLTRLRERFGAEPAKMPLRIGVYTAHK
ncbi:methyltransferase domain-containing protein [Pseudohalocynthiibacter sp. F2068]|uniref:class I SAM-dependent methyltransferase n=1 Tax=Pseudohalocynthiibacter sp. F2068 TaxID=2926418 RepID=UPI001FF57AA6|nr:methyltransferase domain-containing protein [Pseudohalocynthiibacter sp. F2068]MCK0104126.1 methyltransferase domain-containing protein [Pseudohalocynthiibacter sp. F2068]